MKNKSNDLSIAGFIISLCSLFLTLDGIISIAGLTLSAIGWSQAKKSNEKTGLATSGVIIGIIGVLYIWFLRSSII